MATHQRRHDIDWLRVLAMLSVFLFHCARFFDYEDWHVKNLQTSFGFTVFVGILVQWIMPIFFVLSGQSTWFALRFRNAGQYIGERFKRLFIPLVFGIFVLIPPQVYIELVSHGRFEGSFFRFYPHYFDGFYGFGGNFAWMGLHLWFLLVLFLFSLVSLPLLLFLRGESRSRFIQKMARLFEKPGAILLWLLPLVVMEFSFHPAGLGRRDMGGWNVFVYLVFFLYGFLLASDERYRRTVEKHRVILLALAALTTLIGFHLRRSGIDPSFGSLGYLGISALRTFNSWVWVLALLGIGSRYLTFRNRLLQYASEAVLPFYILHQSIIVVIGFFIINWNTPVFVKYLFLSMSSFVTIILIYEYVVKRLGFMRFLFGLKGQKKRA
ncbi:MAG: acyltransferase family protein [Candidatus Aminicenantes bacterium]|nr:acyltransferase family protein [Candidatus Aminicenantes bacterium]